MFKVVTSSGIISDIQDTDIEDIEVAKEIARLYFVSGYDSEVRCQESDEVVFFYVMNRR